LGLLPIQFGQAFAVVLHFVIAAKCAPDIAENLGGLRVGWLDDPIVPPFSLAACFDQTRTAKVRKVAGDFWLGGLKRLHQRANANLFGPKQMNDAKSGFICESFEKLLKTEVSVSHLHWTIRAG